MKRRARSARSSRSRAPVRSPQLGTRGKITRPLFAFVITWVRARAPQPINLAPNRVVRLRRVFDARERRVGSPAATRPLETGRPDSPRRVLEIIEIRNREEMAISPPRTPAPANGRAKNLSTPDILAAMMDSDSEDELVRPGTPTSRARAPDLSNLKGPQVPYSE